MRARTFGPTIPLLVTSQTPFVSAVRRRVMRNAGATHNMAYAVTRIFPGGCGVVSHPHGRIRHGSFVALRRRCRRRQTFPELNYSLCAPLSLSHTKQPVTNVQFGFEAVNAAKERAQTTTSPTTPNVGGKKNPNILRTLLGFRRTTQQQHETAETTSS